MTTATYNMKYNINTQYYDWWYPDGVVLGVMGIM